MWIDPSHTSASYQNSTGTTPLSAIGTVADSANPVGLTLDRRLGATALAHPGNHLLQATSTARPLASAKGGQTVAGDGTYNAGGYPIYDQFDGIDDGLSTATFAAGTLTSSMDCLIAVRRDSATGAVCGLYFGAGIYTGACISGGGSPNCGNVGTPTTWVDGIQLAGGTGVTGGTVYNALTVGPWHILEFRGLNLSAWTVAKLGDYASYALNGGFGGIRLFPATNDAIRNLARTELAAKVGLVL